MTLAVYAYQTAAGTQAIIDADDYQYTGTWSAAGTYKAATLDTVAYGNARYLAILDNVGGNPTLVPPRNIPKKWSLLAKIREGAEPPWPSDPVPPDVAVTALETAWAGTSLAAEAYTLAAAGTTLAAEAYSLALAGTEAAATAWVLAEAGTNAASAAQSTANDALDLAAGARDTAVMALETAWAGTAAAAQTAWVGPTPGVSGTIYAALEFNGSTVAQLVFTNGILTGLT